jgi:beta-glucosidase
MVGAWSGANNFSDVRTLRETLTERAQEHGGSLIYAKGTDISGTSTSGFAEAVDMARNADLVVMALGESSAMSGEAASRAYLDLPGNQQQLLEAVQATGKPVVLLIFSGRPLVLDWAADHVPAIMEVWFPGVETGPAIANVLYGTSAPSGKLTMSFPRAVGQEPLYYNQLPTGRPIQHFDPAHPNAYVETKYVSRYLDVPNDALFPFGHGLTYTTFRYANVSVSHATVSVKELMRDRKAQPLVATAEVTNTGNREGTEIVQCYINVRGASTEQPVRTLKGFARITLKPGESRTVSFPLGFEELSFYNVKAQATVEPGTEYTVYIGGNSTAEQAAHFRLTQ